MAWAYHSSRPASRVEEVYLGPAQVRKSGLYRPVQPYGIVTMSHVIVPDPFRASWLAAEDSARFPPPPGTSHDVSLGSTMDHGDGPIGMLSLLAAIYSSLARPVAAGTAATIEHKYDIPSPGRPPLRKTGLIECGIFRSSRCKSLTGTICACPRSGYRAFHPLDAPGRHL